MEEAWSLETKQAIIFMPLATPAAINVATKIASALAGCQTRVTILTTVGKDPDIRGRMDSDASKQLVEVAEVGDTTSRYELSQWVTDVFMLRTKHVDILINLGVCASEERVSASNGHELTWALNVDAPLTLTHIMLQHLASSPPGVVINVVSDGIEDAVLGDDRHFVSSEYHADDALSQAQLGLAMYNEYCFRRYGQASRQLFFYTVAVPGIPGLPTTTTEAPLQASVDSLVAFLGDRTNFANRVGSVLSPVGKASDKVPQGLLDCKDGPDEDAVKRDQDGHVQEWMNDIGGLSEDPLAVVDDFDIFSALLCCAGGR